jgi:hypothetical protein
MHHYNSALKTQLHSSKRLNIKSKYALVLEHQALKMDKGDGSKGPYLESQAGHPSCSHSLYGLSYSSLKPGTEKLTKINNYTTILVYKCALTLSPLPESCHI